MRDLLNKFVSLGLGLAVVTKEQAEKLVDELVKKGEMSRAESFAFVDDLLKKGEEAQARIETLVRERVQAAVGERKWATREDVARLEKRLDALIAKLDGQAAHAPEDTADGSKAEPDLP